MNQNQKIAVIGVAALVIGFFAGREEMKLEFVRSLASAFSGFANPQASALTSGPSTAETERIAAQAAKNQKKQSDLAYAKAHLEIYDFTASYQNAMLGGKTAGVNFKLKNNGEKTFTEISVNVYFQDDKGTTLAEENFCPVLATQYSIGEKKPLKPGYIRQQERNSFYA